MLTMATDDPKQFLAGPAPLPAPKRKPRKPTLAAALKQAERAGQSVRSAEIYSDHVTLEFGRPEPPAPAADDNEWDQDLGAPSAVTIRP